MTSLQLEFLTSNRVGGRDDDKKHPKLSRCETLNLEEAFQILNQHESEQGNREVFPRPGLRTMLGAFRPVTVPSYNDDNRSL